MSDEEIRRPRRIITAPPLPPSATGAVSPLTLQADRFQRALAGAFARRSDTPRLAPPPEPPPAAASAPHPPANAAAAAAPAPAQTIAAVAPAADPAPTRAAATVLQMPMPMPQPHQPPPQQHPNERQGDGKSAKPDDWDADLAKRIGVLCRKADPSFQSWSVTIPLDPAVLPETELHLQLSPHRLLLRFHTQSPHSLQLVSRHRDRLMVLLAKALPFEREIDLELT